MYYYYWFYAQKVSDNKISYITMYKFQVTKLH